MEEHMASDSQWRRLPITGLGSQEEMGGFRGMLHQASPTFCTENHRPPTQEREIPQPLCQFPKHRRWPAILHQLHFQRPFQAGLTALE